MRKTKITLILNGVNDDYTFTEGTVARFNHATFANLNKKFINKEYDINSFIQTSLVKDNLILH